MAIVVDICKDGVVCRSSKRMWECRGEECGMKLQKILTCWSQRYLDFSLGLLIYTRDVILVIKVISTIYGRLPQYFWMRNVCSVHKQEHETRVTGKRYWLSDKN